MSQNIKFSTYSILITGLILFLVIILSFLAYIIITGDNPRDKDNKIFKTVKNDCIKLQNYILNNYESSFNIDEAKDRYQVMCK